MIAEPPFPVESAEQRSGVARTRVELPELASLDVRILRISDRVRTGPERHLARSGNAGNTGYPVAAGLPPGFRANPAGGASAFRRMRHVLLADSSRPRVLAERLSPWRRSDRLRCCQRWRDRDPGRPDMAAAASASGYAGR